MLSLFQRRTEGATHGAPERQRSLGLRALLPESDDQEMRVLDLGPAQSRNMEFVAGYGGELTVADLYRGLMTQKLESGNDEALSARRFSELLSFSADTRFDSVLLWDVLNYLSPDEQQTLMRTLEPFCVPGTAFLAFIRSQKEMPPAPSLYTIESAETIVFEAPKGRARPSPRYLEGNLLKQLYALTVENRYQLRNGMLEYVFSYRMSTRVDATGASESRQYRLAPASR